MQWWTAPALLVGLPAAYFAARHVGQGMLSAYDAVYKRARVWQMDRLHLRDRAYKIVLDNLMHLSPDERGRLGMLVGPGSILNMDTHARFDDEFRIAYIDPLREKVDAIQKTLLAMPSRTSESAQDLLPEVNQAQLPTQISLNEALGMHVPTLDSLLLGVTLNEAGKMVPIYRSIYQLMHLFSVGRTGAGKSSWMLSFLAQLDRCKQDMEVILIDVHGAAFNVCQDWSSLRYPVARNNQQAKLVLQQVIDESERRGELFRERPLAKDLASYNALVEPDRKLVPWVTVIDEGTLMLADSSISSYVANCVQGTRQYGLFVFMTGQTGNANIVKSEIRGNFPTRVCYPTEKAMMAAALGESPPSPLPDIPGRAWAKLLGRQEPYMIQSPYIRHDEFYRQLEHEGPRYEMPEAKEKDQRWTADELWALWNNTPAYGRKTAICKALWPEGKPGIENAAAGAHHGHVREACNRVGIPWD